MVTNQNRLSAYLGNLLYIFLNHKVRQFAIVYGILKCLISYNSVIASATLCLIIKGIGGKIRNY